VEKILEGGVDGEDDVAESDDGSVEWEGAKRRAREKWRKQKYDEAQDFVRKFREEIATFERAQMDAERGNFASPSYATASASKPKYFGERGRRRAARKGMQPMKAIFHFIAGLWRNDAKLSFEARTF
jgi:hypothetical protein